MLERERGMSEIEGGSTENDSQNREIFEIIQRGNQRVKME